MAAKERKERRELFSLVSLCSSVSFMAKETINELHIDERVVSFLLGLFAFFAFFRGNS